MKKILIPLLLVCFAFISIQTSAQKMSKTFSFGFGLESALPLGDAGEAFSFAPGLTLRASYKVGPGFATLTSGGLIFIPKKVDADNLQISLQIPVKAGYKFIYKDHFFAMGEIGFSNFKTYYKDLDDNVASISQSGVTFAPTIGYQAGTFEIGLRYEHVGFKNGSLSTAGLRLGFNF